MNYSANNTYIIEYNNNNRNYPKMLSTEDERKIKTQRRKNRTDENKLSSSIRKFYNFYRSLLDLNTIRKFSRKF